METPETIAAMLTPQGRGAVAVIAVRGQQAEACVQRYFRAASGKPVESQPLGRIRYGRWGDAAGEEVLLVREVPGQVELHCHGGIAAPQAILADLECAGCRIADAWEMLALGTPDEIQWEAARALARATTERTAAILLDQYRGALARAIAELETALAASNGVQVSRTRIERLLALADVGKHLTQPWRVVLAGQPNVGKSSLMNVLAGYERAIVFDAPGTTRDALSMMTAIEGWPVELTDTAGMRPTGDSIEQQAIEQARHRLAAAELVVLVFDLSRSWSKDDERMLQGFPNAIVVHNKQDLALECELGGRPAGLSTSAQTGAGVPALVREIGRRLVPHPPLAGEAVPFTDRQITHLLALRDLFHASS